MFTKTKIGCWRCNYFDLWTGWAPGLTRCCRILEQSQRTNAEHRTPSWHRPRCKPGHHCRRAVSGSGRGQAGWKGAGPNSGMGGGPPNHNGPMGSIQAGPLPHLAQRGLGDGSGPLGDSALSFTTGPASLAPPSCRILSVATPPPCESKSVTRPPTTLASGAPSGSPPWQRQSGW